MGGEGFAACKCPAGTAEGTAVSLPFGNQKLRAPIGTVRELVSCNLSRWQA